MAFYNVFYSKMYKNTLYNGFVVVLIYDIFYVCYLLIFHGVLYIMWVE